MDIRSIVLVVFLAPAMCLGGCVSFKTGTPLYDRSEAVVAPSLIGVWENEDMRLTIDLAPEHGMCTHWEHFDSQTLESSEPPRLQPTDFVAFGNYFYMFLPSEQQDCTTTEYGWTFLRIHREADELEMSMLNPFAMQARLYDDPQLLTHHCEPRAFTMIDGDKEYPAYHHQHMVVTASSAELRSFLIEHENDPEMFVYLSTLRRER